MTRKQALQAALTHLQQTNADPEIMRILSEISDELPLVKWTNASVRDAVDQYIADHGKLPNPKEFGKKNLPSGTVFKLHYNMSTGEWLEQNYSVRANRKQKILDDFMANYNRIQPGTAHEYDTKKSPGSAFSKTMMKEYKAASWHDLLTILNLPIYPPRSVRHYPEKIKVKIYCGDL